MRDGRKTLVRRFGVLALSATAIAGLLLSTPNAVAPSYAISSDLPTWSDVEKAKQNEASAAEKVKEIEALLVEVQAEVEQTRAESEAATKAFYDAEQALLKAQERTVALTEQAKQSQEEADAASEQAASLVAQLYRSGGVDRNVEIFLESDASAADQLLERLAQVEKATERNTSLADAATRARNTAETLGNSAQAAEDERDRLHAEAEEQKEIAAAAAAAAGEKLVEHEEQQKQLETQLAALKDETTETTKGYQERLRLEEEERQEAIRKAQEEAANAGGGGGGGSTGGGGGSGQVSGGFQVPLYSYYVSDWWGAGRGHTGVDLAAPQWTPIYAAAAGTVTMSGWYSPCYANMVEITHGGGIATRYAHQVQQPLVRYGQWVERGQLIGYVGTTGCSFGPHLHFEVYSNGYPIDPAPFYASKGLYF